ncbi:MAG: glycosyltransferase [Tissierellia bacterium]|nr:glycosyltransferase [Tissierellia bacterium]
MLKVLHLISGGDTGGAKTHIYSLMKGFKGLVDAHTVVFVPGPFYDEAKAMGLKITLVRQKGRFDLKSMDVVARMAKEEGVDLIHCHGARANFNALFLRNKLHLPMVSTLHSDYLLDFKGHFIKDKIFTPMNVYALKRFPYYIAITENFKEMLIRRGFPKERIFVVYNGIDYEKEERAVSKEEFLARYGLNFGPDDPIFVMAARLDLVKDHRTLLRALSSIKDRLGTARFLLAGTGRDEEYLKEFVAREGLADHVFFLGQVQDPFSLFGAGDVNLLTSKSESFPYALLEGAKAGLAFVASNVGGISEMAGQGGGLLFEGGNAQDLARVLLEVLDDPQGFKKRGAYLHQYVRENFSAGAMAHRHLEIYEEILGGQQQ